MNPYKNEVVNSGDFLEITYKLMQRKVQRLIQIQKSKKRNKLPLPLLKEKLDIISNLIKANKELLNIINYDDKMGRELADILNDMSIILARANVSDTEALQKYDVVLAILDGFLTEP